MLKGVDISHWNNVSEISFADKDFCFIKASEGRAVIDSKRDANVKYVKDKNPDCVIGFYHYARPEYNENPRVEADNFVRQVLLHVEKEPTLLALDWEGASLKENEQWALDWLKYVYEKTGIKPLIYTPASAAQKMSFLFEEDFGLWVAHWNVKKPKINGWPFWAFWQYTSRPFDKNYFNGTREQLMKYATRKE